MITIHQAIYGERSGYSLLNSSETIGIAKQISGYTDLTDRPEGGILSTPVIRCFWVQSCFLIVKTFPDLSPGMRPGRVFSHALIINKDDFYQITNISDLFKFHLSVIDKVALLQPIHYIPLKEDFEFSSTSHRESAGINALIDYSDYNNCIAWVGGENYWGWIKRIWFRLPVSLKDKIRLGAAFDPQRINSNELSLVYVPEEKQANWARHLFKIISLSENEKLEDPIAKWLSGDLEIDSDLKILLNDFEPNIQKIEDVKLLFELGKCYLNLGDNTKLNQLLVFSNHISNICKKNENGQVGKKKLLDAIVRYIPSTSSSMIKALMYQSWKGFSNPVNRVEPIVVSWLEKKILNKNQDDQEGAILLQALEVEKENWWSKIVLSFLRNKFKKWQNSYSNVVWNWMIQFPKLIEKHEDWLPISVETELANSVPKLSQEISGSILKLARDKKWLVLHGVVLSKSHSIKDALDRQLKLDTDENYLDALKAIAKSIKRVDFLEASILLNEPRLWQISGQIIKDRPSLKKNLNVQNQSWISIWKESIKQGVEIWEGIQSPQNTLYSIMDLLINEKAFDDVLIRNISESSNSSLKRYPNRKNIWDKLPLTSKAKIAETTAFDCIEDLISGTMEFNDLEPFLINLFQSEEILTKVVSAQFVASESKIKLFNIISSLKEQHAKRILESPLNNQEAKLLGLLIKQRNWNTLAQYIYQNRNRRMDFRLILDECGSLLNLLQRLDLSIHGKKSNQLTTDEWWELFFEIAIELYPEGPDQNGLWSNAGGSVADIHIKTTGKKSWTSAVEHLKKEGGKPTRKNLLEEMKKDFSNNDILNKLHQIK